MAKTDVRTHGDFPAALSDDGRRVAGPTSHVPVLPATSGSGQLEAVVAVVAAPAAAAATCSSR